MPLAYAVGNARPPTKVHPESWWSQAAWQRYLGDGTADSAADFANDSDFSDPEHSIGIGMDSSTGTQNGEQFYSAHSLRLREGWRLDTLAEAQDKVTGNGDARRDLIAKLVAAIIGKPVPVTGYALPNAADPDRPDGGAKSTHLAVPAGTVYYFECADEASATALATALNWHGESPGTEIRNRRSTLMGEKGFGLGVCGTWQLLP